MGQTILYPNKIAYVNPMYPNEVMTVGSVVTLETYGITGTETSELLMSFRVPTSLNYLQISSIELILHPWQSSDDTALSVYPLLESFSSSATYATKPQADLSFPHQSVPAIYSEEAGQNRYTGVLYRHYDTNAGGSFRPADGRNGLEFGVSVRPSGIEASAMLVADASDPGPRLVINYYDSPVPCYITGMTPASGWAPKAEENVFTWEYVVDFSVNAMSGFAQYYSEPLTYKDIALSYAYFRWRTSETAEENLLYAYLGTSISVAANTFTTDTIQWNLQLGFTSGVTAYGTWTTLSTLDAISSAKALSPVNIIVEGSQPLTFQWAHIIETGTVPTGFSIQLRTETTEFSSLHYEEGTDATSHTFVAGTFLGGEYWWRVRTYNVDGEAGLWSEAVKFTVVSAPQIPVLSIAELSPRPSIRWQTTGQQAYEVQVGNIYRSGVLFGSQQNWKSPVYLADGSYTVRVRAQNQYGMWSEWGEASLPVANVAGATISLAALGGGEATLSWQTEGAYDFYLVLRDGETIAKVTEKSYTDHFSAGDLTYQVRGCYNASGSYGLSNEAAVAVAPENIMISPVPEADWLPLPLSDLQHRETGETLEREVTYNLMSGYEYPIAERGEHKDRYLRVTAALADRDSRKRLEAMTGALVCVKTPHNGAVVGVLGSLTFSTQEFYTVYNFTIRQSHWKEAVQIDS